MAGLTVVFVAILSISFVTFVAFFGRLPALRRTPIGALSRLLWIHIPNFLGRVDKFVTGGRTVDRFYAFGDYLVNQKHPVVLIFFLGLVYSSAGLFLANAWAYLAVADHVVAFILLPLPFITTYTCQKSNSGSPHLITWENHAEQMRQYPYDYMLFYPGVICRTCKFEKPARSKHCSLCKACVARCDHHCIWVNNCVGRGNYKWFLAVCLSTGLLVAYGAFLAWKILRPAVRTHFDRRVAWYQNQRFVHEERDFFDRVFVGKLETILDVLVIAFDVGGISIAGIGLLCLLTFPLPVALFLYHVYLIWAGMTTNESGKWSDWKEDMKDGVVFLGRIRRGSYEDQSEVSNGHRLGDEDDGINWPYRSQQCLIMTRDGNPPRYVPEPVSEVLVRDSWQPVYKLKDVVNIYDLGFWDNMLEVLRN